MDNYLGEIRLFAGPYAPQDWHFCDGSSLNISDYQALYALIGTTYGGNGVTTFNLPNLQQRVPVGTGQLAGGSNYTLAATGGVTQVTLTPAQMPAHTHALNANTADATTGTPTNNYFAASNGNNSTLQPPYANVKLYMPLPSGTTTPNATLDPSTVSQAFGSSGATVPHQNMMPYMSMNYIIALLGVYPQAQ